jgi:four helix bundle protein
MNEKEKKPIKSFHVLEVYQESYEASLNVINKVIPKLPKEEKDDLGSQMRRSCKSVPRLIAEGYGKRHQNKGFQKYLDDANGESNEMIVNLSHCKDLYTDLIDIELCDELLDTYDMTSRKLFKLAKSWSNIKRDDN